MLDDIYDRRHDENIKVKILDIRTGNTLVDDRFSHYWWYEGNGSCDCNRSLFMKQAGIDVPPYEEYEGICSGCRYFLIVEAPTTCYSLREFNEGYPEELLRKFNII